MKCAFIIDDDPYFRDILTRLLGGLYRVVSEPDGAAALLRCKEAPPDLVMLDMRLPGLGGPEVAERLARDPRTAAVSIVAFSAGRMEPPLRRTLARHGVRYVLDKLSPPRDFLAAAVGASPPDGR